MRSETRMMIMALAGGALAVAAAPAAGQNALGDGRALDNNLREGSGGRNTQIRDIAREIRLRNAIVTGRAPGGLSFRGDVGYSAVDDFRAETSDDDLFAFDRDSFGSALTGRGVRGIDALQMQMQLTVGGFVGEGDFLADPILSQSSDAASADTLGRQRALMQQYGSNDPLRFRPGSLRSTSEYLAQSSQTPVLLQVQPRSEEDQTLEYTLATPLRSVTTQEEPRFSRRLSDLLERADAIQTRLDRELEGGRLDAERPFRPGDEPDAEGEGEGGEADEGEAEGRGAGVHRRILDAQLGLGPLEGETEGEAGDGAARDGGEDGGGAGDGRRGELVPENEVLERLRELREELMRPDQGLPEYGGSRDEEGPDKVEALRRKIAETADAVFAGGEVRVEAIAPPADEAVDLYGRHMREGEQHLAAGRWFAAEERFTSALGLRPGDPMAAVGRVHAQIGGGMFLSAGLNIQKLFRSHPELINVRYDGPLLPLGDRLDEVNGLLVSRMRGENEFARGAAMVRAYLGFQRSERAWIEEGLGRVEEIERGRGDGVSSLTRVLRTAWGSGDGSSGEGE